MGQLELFAEYLPERPYCTDVLGSLRISGSASHEETLYSAQSPWNCGGKMIDFFVYYIYLFISLFVKLESLETLTWIEIVKLANT
jgi:hypothetical protein